MAGSAVAVILGVLTGLLGAVFATALGALLVPIVVILWMRCGVLALVCVALGLSAQLPWQVAVFALAAVGPAAYLCVYRLSHKAPAYHAVFHTAAASFGGMMLFWGLYAAATGESPAVAIVDYLAQILRQWVAELPSAAASVWGLEEMIDQLFVQGRESLMAGIIPQMTQIACLTGLLGAVVPIRFFRLTRRADSVSQLAPLPMWRVPRRVTIILMPTYIVAYMLLFFGVPGMDALASAVWQAVQVVYLTALLSAVAQALRRGGVGASGRNALLALCVVGLLIAQMFYFIAMMLVLVGSLVEIRRMRLPAVPGEEHSPFGPPGMPPGQGRGEEQDDHDVH